MARSLSVVLSTYNALRELECVLAGFSRQTVDPIEILVADDGSSLDTVASIDKWRSRIGAPIRHVWHEDRGRCKAEINNKAARHARGDYIAFIDGDTIPHSYWVQDHLERSRPNRVLCGRRGRLGPRISPTITPKFVAQGGLEAWFGCVGQSARVRDSRKLARSIRLPLLASWIIGLKPRRLMGCNYSLPRKAFLDVNGYDEGFNEYGGEDRELEARLRRYGMRLVPIINRGCVFHLHHKQERVRPDVRARCDALIALSRLRCEAGIDSHAEDDLGILNRMVFPGRAARATRARDRHRQTPTFLLASLRFRFRGGTIRRSGFRLTGRPDPPLASDLV